LTIVTKCSNQRRWDWGGGGCWGNLKERHRLKDNGRRLEDNIKMNLKKEDGRSCTDLSGSEYEQMTGGSFEHLFMI
jgi:hypothetical protein